MKNHHIRLEVKDDAIIAAVNLSKINILLIGFLPDKAIDLIDERLLQNFD